MEFFRSTEIMVTRILRIGRWNCYHSNETGILSLTQTILASSERLITNVTNDVHRYFLAMVLIDSLCWAHILLLRE